MARWPEFSSNGFEPISDFFEGFFPTDAREPAFALRSNAALRVEKPFGRVLALEIAGDLAAEETPCDGMAWIATEAAAFAVLDVDQQTASVGAIERADGLADFGRQREL
jgi:hypothetical protein